jgi:hypothetical protein
VVELLVGPPLARGALGEHRADRLVEADVVADRDRLVGRHRQRERRRELGHGLQQPRLPVLLGEDVLLRGREQGEPLLGVPGHPGAVVEAVEKALADLRPGDAVYEPFSGSGTTLMAAETLGWRCYAMEIDPKYVQVAIERWQRFTGREAARD